MKPMLPWILILVSLAGCGREPSGGAVEERLAPAVRETVSQALADYETIRAALAEDDLSGAVKAAGALASAIESPPADGDNVRRLTEAREAASHLAEAADLAAARVAFAELSRVLVLLASQSTELSGARYLFQCPMVEGFNRWIQLSDSIANPYMGSRMLRCGSPVAWPRVAASAGGTPGAAAEIAYYTCPMHPSIRQSVPGTCPICAMDLVPVTQEELRTGTITVDATRRQRIGVRTATVVRKPVGRTIRAVGRVAYDESALADVSLKVGGWIGTLHADAPGIRVRKGEVLFTLYSPELYTAQVEYLTALRSQTEAAGGAAPARADYLVEAARDRLRLWDLTDAQIDGIAAAGEPRKYLPILSPVGGYVVEKNVVEGASVSAGMQLFRIADLDRIWVEADLYESETGAIAVGRQARVSLPFSPEVRFEGKVAFVYPYLDGATRTLRVRIELPNAGLELKPDMFADVELTQDLGTRLTVPETAVLYAGTRQFVFVDLGDGKLRPRSVELGVRAGDDVEVLSGLEEGDVIVTSGNFLIAAESRLKTALEQW